MSLGSEMAALERKWARRRRRYEALGAIAWALFALIVFAGTAHETGKLAAANLGAGQASHKAGPSIVADQRHSKTEGKCR